MTDAHTKTVEVPENWTSYIFNDDPSALTELEQRQCDAWLKERGIDKEDFLGCDAMGYFTWDFHQFGTGHHGGNVVSCKLRSKQ